METTTYDHIDYYLKNRINDPNAPEVRNLIADFALLWNQYERTLYKKEHHIYEIKKTIKKFKLDDIEEIDELYDRFTKYVISRDYEFTVDDIHEMFNINFISKQWDEKKQKYIFKGDIHKRDLENAINIKDKYNKIYLLLLISAKVRNNMFHGTKGAWELPKQKDLFRICNETLMCVLKKTHMEDI